MRKLSVILMAVMAIAGCRHAEESAQQALPFHPLVEAFTYGSISRTTPVYLVFNRDLPAENMTPELLRKAMKIRPAVKGEFAWENSRTVVFTPQTEFERGRQYSVTADLSQFFDVQDKQKEFTFAFSVLPLSLSAQLASFDINMGNEAAYDISIDIRTPDAESAETIEPLVGFSEKGEVSWQHDADGRRHQIKISGVEAGDQVRMASLSVLSNRSGVKKGEILSTHIPARDEFGVYDYVYHTDPERYIEVTFTKLLDPAQDLTGLAYIMSNDSQIVQAEGNKVRLYPDAGKNGTVGVSLDASIRNSAGMTLGSDISLDVDISYDVPAVQFEGNGVIIPNSTRLLVPFKAVYLRGVVVRVIRVLEQNMGRFLQDNTLDGYSDLIRAGRIVARKTIFLEDQGQDLTQWGKYAVDLSERMEPEPGAIYRVELSFDRELSAYPCSNTQPLNREQIEAQDEIKLRDEMNRFDEGGYYYYYNDFDWSDYNYEERDDPCSNNFYSDTNIGRNVLATDLGIIAKAGEGGEMVVSVHNILTTDPEKDVDVKAYNYQGQVIAQGTTDAEGMAALRMEKGRPYYLIATKGKQRSYLRVDSGTALSLSSFDVSGEVIQKGLKGFIYGDRGVWRPGDTLHMSFMLGDRGQTLPAEHPVVMELYNPLGQLHTRTTQTSGALGLYAFSLPVEQDAPTGSWNVKVLVGGATFEKRIRIETIKPNRLKIDLRFDDKVVRHNTPAAGKLHVEWLQGATARNLKYEIDASLLPATTSFPGFEGYVFDDPSKSFTAEQSRFAEGTTDENGAAAINGKLAIGDAAPGMLTAALDTRVYEESGDFSIDAVRMPYSPYHRYAGIRSPQKDENQLDTGSDHRFDVASVDYLGNPLSGTRLDVRIYKVDWYWWWSSDKAMLGNYISDSYNSPVRDFSVTTGGDGRGSFDLNFSDGDWGTYFIVVRDPVSEHSAGVMSYFDWPSWGGRRDMEGGDAATMLSFKTDKERYAPGDEMIVMVPSAQGSLAVVSIENGSRVLSTSQHACQAGETRITIPVTEQMQPNAYVYVTLLQPHGATLNDLPIRLYGVQPVTVSSPESYLHPVLTTPDEIKPETEYSITVSEEDGREMAYTIAIVDEGLLDLTRFKTPDPWNAFNAREALGVSTWDMYNYVAGAYGGRIEQIFSIGGDDALAAGPKAIVNRFKPVVQFDGPFILKKGGSAKHTYRMPNYNGRVRVMIVAGDGRAYGNTEKSVVVKKPVMLLGTLPRVIGTGEEMVVPATVFATEKNVGDVQVSITASENMEIMGPASQQLNFNDISDKQAAFRIRVGSRPGAGRVTLTAVSGNDRSTYETDIEVRSVRRPQTMVTSAAIGAGESWKQTVTMPGMEGTNKLTLELSDIEPVNLSSRLGFLLGYPHGCIEQITSKGFPQLYLKQFASLTKAQEELASKSVEEVIRRQRSYQVAEGGFSYWPGGTSSNAWGSIYATHFQIEAEARGFLVPSGMKNSALDNLRLVARGWRAVNNPYSNSEELTQAYRLYVLALARTPETGAMNRMRESGKLAPMTQWTLAAAYAAAGYADQAKSLIESTTAIGEQDYDEYDMTYGSGLRDKAIRLITLVQTGDATQSAVLAGEISKSLSSDQWLSTQSTGFALVALSQYMDKYKTAQSMEFAYSCAGKGEKVSTDKNIWSETLLENAGRTAPVEVNNTGGGTLFLRLITEGTPDQGEEAAYAHGLKLDFAYLDMNGNPIDVSSLRQGTNFTAVATVGNPTGSAYKNISLSQIFPSGWEILNTRFTDENATDSYAAGVSYQDIRDDRVYSYIDLLPAGKQVTVRINLAAAYEGMFYHPPVWAEAMYDNTVRANTRGSNVTVVK